MTTGTNTEPATVTSESAPARPQAAYLGRLASLTLVDMVLTGVFLVMTPDPVAAIAVALPLNLAVLGGLNALGGWLIFRPVAALLAGSGERDKATARLHNLPAISAAWGVAVTLVYCAAVFASGALAPEQELLAELSRTNLALASGWFALVYAIYYGFYIYFVITDLSQGLRAQVYSRFRVQLPPGQARLARKMTAVFLIVTLVPLTLIVVDLSVFRDVRAAQGLGVGQTMLLDGLSTAFVLVVASFFVTRSLSRPLTRLVQGHKAVSQGNVAERAPVMRDDEVGILTVSFNEMVADLQAQSLRISKQLEQIAQLQSETEDAFQQTVHLLARAAELHDEVTGAHTVRVGEYSRCLAERLGQPEPFCREIAYAAQLHDVGKMSVDTAILTKPGKLDEAEWQEIKRHTELGYQILAGVDRLEMARDIALSHHERWDGGGYPYGWAGEDIPLAARITAMADIYDALRSARPYKAGFSHEEAVAIMLHGDARLDPTSHFDPNLLALFARFHEDFRAVWESYLNAAAAQ